MPDPVVENPTYLGDIRHFFTETDIQHMAAVGIDLGTYQGVRARATSIYFATQPPNASMPPPPAPQWSAERSQTFGNWIRNGYPLGQPEPQPVEPEPTAGRVRKDVAALDATEVDRLKAAFAGMMARDDDDPESYFALAGQHWFPNPFCVHHESRYNPWHRVFMVRFEDAMRTVEGCESVTLPYWDITTRPPDFLFEPPFAGYTLPQEIHPEYPAGYVTSRYGADRIVQNLATYGVTATIEAAMSQPTWEAFVTYTGQGIEAAHDSGHVSTGVTMSVPDAAAFDPIFWFFHSNWDRLWWEWQQKFGATTLATFRSTITGSSQFLDPPFNTLEPFPTTADLTVDLRSFDVAYTSPERPGLAADAAAAVSTPVAGSLPALEAPRVADAAVASVRLKGVHRLAIPGSFTAVLMADGEEVGRRAFFQSTTPVDCGNCRETPDVDLDFLVDVDRIQGRTLTASLQLARPTPELGDTVPLGIAGEPTINVRLLLERA